MSVQRAAGKFKNKMRRFSASRGNKVAPITTGDAVSDAGADELGGPVNPMLSACIKGAAGSEAGDDEA